MVSVEDLVRHEEKQLNRYMMNYRETVMQAVYERVKINWKRMKVKAVWISGQGK